MTPQSATPADHDDVDDATDTVDGRTARRDRNRAAVLDAMIELFAEGHIPPTAPEAAERSGVSLRSVYRYFDDHDQLVIAAVIHHAQRIDRLFWLDRVGEGPLDERIDRLVDHRLALYEAVAPVARVAFQIDDTAIVAQRIRQRQQELGAQAIAMFTPEMLLLDDTERFELGCAIDAATRYHTIDFYRRELGLDVDRTHSIMVGALHRLVAVTT
jgi:AcrR family transcriptional regulator